MQLEPQEKRLLARRIKADPRTDRQGHLFDEGLAALVSHIEACPRCGKRLVELRRKL